MSGDLVGVPEALQEFIATADDGLAPPIGASAEDIDWLSSLYGRTLPRDFQSWLRLCNGLVTPRGCLLGQVADGGRDLDISAILDVFPEKIIIGWLPVATDDFGNEYSMLIDRDGPDGKAVYFTDEDFLDGSVGYAVASSLTQFLLFFFEAEMFERAQGSEAEFGWPFDQEFMLRRDPDLLLISDKSLLPWSD